MGQHEKITDGKACCLKRRPGTLRKAAPGLQGELQRLTAMSAHITMLAVLLCLASSMHSVALLILMAGCGICICYVAELPRGNELCRT